MDNLSGSRLRTALEARDYATAERLITTANDPHILDEPEEDYALKVPLSYVLSIRSTNLYLAKLLVEIGACPNIRIEYPDWDGATASPIEMLFIVIEYASIMTANDIKEQNVIGLNNETDLTTSKYREQLLELLDLFLVRGGNPNVTTSKGNATLFHVCLASASPDKDVVTRLCDAGGDLDQTNVHGTTAFMDLIKFAKGDLAMEIFTELVTKQPDLKVQLLNAENCRSETTLWLAGYAGSPILTTELLKRGADASNCRKIITIPIGMEHNVSPLLAPLLRDSYPHKMFTCVGTRTAMAWNFHLMNKVVSYSVSPILDTFPTNICFPIEAVANLKRLIARLTKFKKIFTSSVNAREVPVTMFGHLSAGLQQLCVRSIVERVIAVAPRCVYSMDSLTVSAVKALTTDKLGLPVSLVPRFYIEAARLQLGYALYKARANTQCVSGCEGLDDDDLESDDFDNSSIFTATSDDDSWERWMDHDYDDSEGDDGGWETMSEESDAWPGWGDSETDYQHDAPVQESQEHSDDIASVNSDTSHSDM